MISAFAYGVDVPMTTAIYQGLVYTVGPLAPYITICIWVGFITIAYLFNKYSGRLWNWFVGLFKNETVCIN